METRFCAAVICVASFGSFKAIFAAKLQWIVYYTDINYAFYLVGISLVRQIAKNEFIAALSCVQSLRNCNTIVILIRN